MSATQKELEFKVGQHVVYPLQGVGVVKGTQSQDFRGEKTLYYEIYLNSSDMKVMIPVKKAKEIGIRAIVSADEALKALDSISTKNEPAPPSDWKDRYRMNMDLLKEGSIQSFAKVVHSLYVRSKVKELPVQERRLYENALGLLIDEASYATGKTPDAIKKIIFAKLEPDAVGRGLSSSGVILPMKKDAEDDDSDLSEIRQTAEAQESDDDGLGDDDGDE